MKETDTSEGKQETQILSLSVPFHTKQEALQ